MHPQSINRGHQPLATGTGGAHGSPGRCELATPAVTARSTDNPPQTTTSRARARAPPPPPPPFSARPLTNRLGRKQGTSTRPHSTVARTPTLYYPSTVPPHMPSQARTHFFCAVHPLHPRGATERPAPPGQVGAWLATTSFSSNPLTLTSALAQYRDRTRSARGHWSRCTSSSTGQDPCRHQEKSSDGASPAR